MYKHTLYNKENLLTEHILTVDARPGLHQAPHEASVQLGGGRVENSAALGVSDVDVTRRAPNLTMTVILMMNIVKMSYQGLYHSREHQAEVQGGLDVPAHYVHHLPVMLQDLVHSNNIALGNKIYHYSKG